MSGNTAVVGAHLEDSSTTGVNSTPNDEASDSGAAYVFVRNGTTWSQQAYLKASNAGNFGAFGAFGASVGVSGDTVIVGAYSENGSTTGVGSTPNDDAFDAGAAYIFTGLGSGVISAERAAALLFIQNAGLAGADAELDATPFDDGIENLLKYAFNMNLSGSDHRVMVSGGDSGLALITVVPHGAASILRFEFVRRKDSGITYTPQKSVDMAEPASWLPLIDLPAVTSIDDDWERVVYEEVFDLQTTPKSFGRLAVDLP